MSAVFPGTPSPAHNVGAWTTRRATCGGSDLAVTDSERPAARGSARDKQADAVADALGEVREVGHPIDELVPEDGAHPEL